jgi:hypothetical protein
MSEERFQDAADLEAWLKRQYVDPEKAEEAAPIVFDKGFDSPSTLMGISSADLQASHLAIPLAQSLSNKLKPQQQQNGELRCCSRIHFCI